MKRNTPNAGKCGAGDYRNTNSIYIYTVGRNYRNREKIQIKDGIRLLITMISKLDDNAQAWTFNIKEEDLNRLMEQYDGRGESVVLDTEDLPRDIQEYYK